VDVDGIGGADFQVSGALIARAGRFVWIIEPDERGVSLFQFGPNGFVGDTWHPNTEEAQGQAAHAMGSIVGPWRAIPRDVSDVQAYGIAQARGVK
jgi:hypothetical protein